MLARPLHCRLRRCGQDKPVRKRHALTALLENWRGAAPPVQLGQAPPPRDAEAAGEARQHHTALDQSAGTKRNPFPARVT